MGRTQGAAEGVLQWGAYRGRRAPHPSNVIPGVVAEERPNGDLHRVEGLGAHNLVALLPQECDVPIWAVAHDR